MKKKQNKEKIKNKLPELKYVGIASQMMVTILLFLAMGICVDSYIDTNIHLFTIIFVIVGVVVAIYNVIKEFLN
ncbi:MAG: AtpZ/AtpI family protein [Marinifilaceae bacterium]|jgi:F0F1-type ATP synthase assembly protein I|nr:AtpZ/AtpI family protein [Marinifilaceae bacterium]